MKRSNFVLKILFVLVISFVFSGCLKNPDQAGEDVQLFQTQDGSSKPVAAKTTLQETDKFDKPLAENSKNTSSDLLEITNELAKDFDLDPSEVKITIESESNASYATGYVNVGEGEKGGIYFAAKENGVWKIAYNGIGTLTCGMIADYSFPVGMIPRCYDMETGMMVDR